MNGISKTIDYHFIVRVIKNEVSPEEKEFFDSWLSESEANRETFSETVLLWDKIGAAPNPPLPNPLKQWENIALRVQNSHRDYEQDQEQDEDQEQDQDHWQEGNKRKKNNETNLYQLSDYQSGNITSIFKSRIFQVAALLLIFVAAGLYFIKIDLPINRAEKPSVMPNIKYVEVKTRKGEKLSITLTDGSKVYLNNESKISFPESMIEGGRNIELEGEAYFSVMPVKDRPFTVKSGNVVTVVKGTEFNIKSRNKTVNVLVVKGLVETFSPKQTKKYNLSKGELLSYKENSGFSIPHKANMNHYLAWRKDKFSFSQTPLLEVMQEIERYYNLKYTFKVDSLKTKTITGFFSSDSINNILSIISLTLDLKIKVSNRNIIIDKN